jgi:hypothetical protein
MNQKTEPRALDAPQPAAKPGNGSEWEQQAPRRAAWGLFFAVLFGFGGLLFAVFMWEAEPQWCQSPFTGCLGPMILFAGGGWVAGLICSLIALAATPQRRIGAWLLLAWNACGCVVFLSTLVMLLR